MSEPVIRVEGLSKKYLLRHEQAQRYTALRDVVSQRVRALGRTLLGAARGTGGASGIPAREEFWALQDVSFEVRQGERIGIIGRNGAGKSTLLKILSRITEPTTGRIELEGRVASLLEVGTGFHPELTGRENIFLNGAILGMGREEIRRKFDEIVAFAEVEKFLDTPVKRYSSGMYVRLAFAVAAHLEPEILVVDEVLAVGDGVFQKKCLGKMEAAGHEGRTVLFVSHNMASVNRLCSTCMLLSHGMVTRRGTAAEVIGSYIAHQESPPQPGAGSEHRLSDPDYELLGFAVGDRENLPGGTFRTTDPIRVVIRYRTRRPLPGLRVGFDLVDLMDGEVLFRSFDDDTMPRERSPGVREAGCTIPADLVRPGAYAIRLQIGIHNVRWICDGAIMERIVVEHVDGVNAAYADQRPGRIMPRIEWS